MIHKAEKEQDSKDIVKQLRQISLNPKREVERRNKEWAQSQVSATVSEILEKAEQAALKGRNTEKALDYLVGYEDTDKNRTLAKMAASRLKKMGFKLAFRQYETITGCNGYIHRHESLFISWD